MRKVVLFVFFAVAVRAFDFDYVSKNDEKSVPQAEETTPQPPAQLPQDSFVRSEVVVDRNETTTSTTSTTTPPLPGQKPREVAEVAEEEEGSPIAHTTQTPMMTTTSDTTTQIPTATLVIKPSLYAIIYEGLKQNLASFEARIASLLHQKDAVKEEIQMFADNDDFAIFEKEFDQKRCVNYYNIIFIFLALTLATTII